MNKGLNHIIGLKEPDPLGDEAALRNKVEAHKQLNLFKELSC